MSWIQTFDGKKFFPHAPDPQAINPRTIATVLSRTPRFGGHSKHFYSVAAHSMWVAERVPNHLKLPALLHDAHEAYSGFGDVLSPVKLQFVRDIECGINLAIAARFGFSADLFDHPEIRQADMLALATEARDLMGPAPDLWDSLPEPHPEPIRAMASREYVRMAYLNCLYAYLRLHNTEIAHGHGPAAEQQATGT